MLNMLNSMRITIKLLIVIIKVNKINRNQSSIEIIQKKKK